MDFGPDSLLSPDEEAQELSAGSQSLLDNAWSHFGIEEELNIPNVLDLDISDDDDDNGTDAFVQSTLDATTTTTTSPWVDLLEESKTSARNGDVQLLSSVSQFVGILSRTGISGPRHLKASNLKTRATKIGSGSQFTVFRDIPDGFLADEDIVVKRVNVPLSFENGTGTFAQGAEYRTQLRSLELEILSLCNPVLRNHRNIVHLIAWGYDYPQPDTPLPVLFMEAALMPLSEFLQSRQFEKTLSQGDSDNYDIKYHLSLDIIAGVEAMHRLNIVHGDLKPENVLVFRDDHPNVPFCAKLSDFGVCIDMENEVNPLTTDDYIGTKAWLAPELRDRTVADFKPELMLRFDAYSAGLVLLSILLRSGGTVDLEMDGEEPVEVALHYIRKEDGIPTAIKRALSSSIRSLLDSNPWKRQLPNTDMLSTDTVTYASWLSVSQRSRQNRVHTGTIDPTYNKGPLFWYRLDESVFAELESQYTSFKEDSLSFFPGDVCFGLAQTVTAMKPTYLDRLIEFLTESAKQGYSPARAVYAQVVKAHGLESKFDEDTLDKWTIQAISEGYLFAEPSSNIPAEEIASAQDRFRYTGGYCSDLFLKKLDVINNLRRGIVPDKPTKSVDHVGNTILHVSAALGLIDSVKNLVEDHRVPVDIQNDNFETPLYKACQAGHPEVLYYLLEKGARGTVRTKTDSLTPLHWLFVFPQEHIYDVAKRLISLGGADINAFMRPSTSEAANGFPRKVSIEHFPFEMPQGTPLHWASFARNILAIDTLLDLGANINAIYDGMDPSTTPLALAVWFSEPELVRHLLSKGADATVKDIQGRNLLHLISHHLPDRHGQLTHYWHYWIRHGNWESHLAKMRTIVKVLVEAGVDLEGTRINDRAKQTPVLLAAATGRIWDAGAICAMLDAGADVDGPRDGVGDTVLHAWSSITGPRIAYPSAYLQVFEKIASQAPNNINIHNKYDKDIPLHLLATIYHPEEEFEAACDILVTNGTKSLEKRVNINAENNRGMTPLFCALEGTNIDAARRGMYLARHWTDLMGHRVDDIKDNFYAIASNRSLGDQKSYDLIVNLLDHLASTHSQEGKLNGISLGSDNHRETVSTLKPIYQHYFEPSLRQNQTSYMLSLWASASSGRLLTTRLLLDLALPSLEISRLLNEPTANYSNSFSRFSTSSSGASETFLDSIMQQAEFARRRYISTLRCFKAGAARERAIRHNLAFDPSDGSPERGAEKYANLPRILRMLREDEYGIKMAIETLSTSKRWFRKIAFKDAALQDGQLLLSPGGLWDLTELYECGYTPETQPHREQWRVLYELAGTTNSDGSDDKTIDYLRGKYTGDREQEKWRPHIKLLQTNLSDSHSSEETELFTQTRDRLLPRIISAFAKLGETDSDGRVWIEACDETSIAAEPKVQVEIVDGVRVGKTRKIGNIS